MDVVKFIAENTFSLFWNWWDDTIRNHIFLGSMSMRRSFSSSKKTCSESFQYLVHAALRAVSLTLRTATDHYFQILFLELMSNQSICPLRHIDVESPRKVTHKHIRSPMKTFSKIHKYVSCNVLIWYELSSALTSAIITLQLRSFNIWPLPRWRKCSDVATMKTTRKHTFLLCHRHTVNKTNIFQRVE